jgi:hypothetical protein
VNTATTRGNKLPRRFLLLPTEDAALQVIMAARCVGYVWTEEERWLARAPEGYLLDTGSGETVFEAVAAVFERFNQQVFLQAQ